MDFFGKTGVWNEILLVLNARVELGERTRELVFFLRHE